jgi:hypothetical protein
MSISDPMETLNAYAPPGSAREMDKQNFIIDQFIVHIMKLYARDGILTHSKSGLKKRVGADAKNHNAVGYIPSNFDASIERLIGRKIVARVADGSSYQISLQNLVDATQHWGIEFSLEPSSAPASDKPPKSTDKPKD